MNKRNILLSLILSAISLLPLQADDFGLWTDAELSQKLGNTGLNADVNLGFRSNNNLKNVDRWSAGFGLSYNLTSFLETAVGYDFLYSYNRASCENKYDGDNWRGYNLENGYWRMKNRFHVDLKGTADIGRFSFSLRERYQLTGYNSTSTRKDKYRYNSVLNPNGDIDYTLREGYPESETDYKKHKEKQYLRSCIKAEYNISGCPVSPYASFEISNNLTESFSLDKRRYSVGADWKIVKGQHLSFGYVYTNGNDDDDEGNLHVIELSYKIKGLFTKK